jgi:hypothetical protein
MESVEGKRRKRLQFMHRLYEVTGGAKLQFVEAHQLGAELGWSPEETDQVTEYLEGEGLVRSR